MKLLSFGEILWDIFDDYKAIGGAPLNVACHFSKLGGQSVLISAVGKDNLGSESLKELKRLKMDTSFIKRTDEETGFSKVVLKDGIPGYRFNSPCAWDNIVLEEEDYKKLRETKWDALYFGTLVQRTEIGRKTLAKIIKDNHFDIILFDVNFRLNFYTKEIIEQGLKYCNILKINDEELEIMCRLLGTKVCPVGLMEEYGLKTIILTEGKKGTTVFVGHKNYHKDVGDVKVVDTVGAGDSLSAGFLFGILSHWPYEKILDKASKLADFVVSRKGAIPDYPEEM